MPIKSQIKKIWKKINFCTYASHDSSDNYYWFHEIFINAILAFIHSFDKKGTETFHIDISKSFCSWVSACTKRSQNSRCHYIQYVTRILTSNCIQFLRHTNFGTLFYNSVVQTWCDVFVDVSSIFFFITKKICWLNWHKTPWLIDCLIDYCFTPCRQNFSD